MKRSQSDRRDLGSGEPFTTTAAQKARATWESKGYRVEIEYHGHHPQYGALMRVYVTKETEGGTL